MSRCQSIAPPLRQRRQSIAPPEAVCIVRVMAESQSMKPKDFDRLYKAFESSISRYDCGRFCAPLNGGSPVCCSVEHAIPVVQKAEWQLLKGRTDLWRKFKPFDKASQDIVDDLADDCAAIECKGARSCERENRTLACRSFPFFPYIDRSNELIGLSFYWDFADRCWVISNLAIVEREFVKEFVDAYEFLFFKDREEFDAYREHSIAMRRVFSRWKRPIPIIGRDGGYFKELPFGRGVARADPRQFRRYGPWRSPEAFKREVRDLESKIPDDFDWQSAFRPR
jgi:hypothetical protein